MPIITDPAPSTIIVDTSIREVIQAIYGTKGDPGPKGDPGAPTAYNARGAWLATATYAKYDLVLYNGSSYFASAPIGAGAAAPGSNATWVLLASRGDPGTLGNDSVATINIKSAAVTATKVAYDIATTSDLDTERAERKVAQQAIITLLLGAVSN